MRTPIVVYFDFTDIFPASTCLKKDKALVSDIFLVEKESIKDHPDMREGVLVSMEEWLEITKNIDEHPEDWDVPCECRMCQSYAEL